MNVVGIIPARMGSTRFPGKPLEKILGKAMIFHVYQRSQLSERINDLYIATCDSEIEQYCHDHNMNCVMTKKTHKRASDRVAEAMEKIIKQTGNQIDILVMIQGDEPMVFPEMIDESVHPFFEDDSIVVTNLMAPLKTRREHEDPNEVKVVVNQDHFALYFSREPIPSNKKEDNQGFLFKQVCIIPFTHDFLLKFNDLKPTPLEQIESVDMLRVLEHGYKVKMVPTKFDTYSVDTKDDLQRVEQAMKNDPLIQKYL